MVGWLMFAASVATYAWLSVAVQHQPFHVGARPLHFFDLRVYRGAVVRLLKGWSIYRRPILRHLGFTYPPFAALLFTPLALVSLGLGRFLVTGVSIVALLFMLRRALAMRRPHAAGTRWIGARTADAWALAAVGAAAALWLEPISVALGYGQIDLLVAALVVFDISRPDGARGKGVATGVAAAIKLTPLVFIAYLALSGRRRAALSGVLTFLAAIAISFVLMPGDASRYWGTLVFQSSRVGNAIDAGNQSLTGALGRLLHEPHLGLGPMVIVAVVAVVGLLLAARTSRRGNEAAGFAVCAITTLEASPVSWTHHWTLAVPALLLLAVAAYERRSRWLGASATGAAAVGYAYLPELTMPRPQLRLIHGRLLMRAYAPPTTGWASFAKDPYVLVGLVALAGAAVVSLNVDLRLARIVPVGLDDEMGRAAPQAVTAGIEHRVDDNGVRVPAAAQSG